MDPQWLLPLKQHDVGHMYEKNLVARFPVRLFKFSLLLGWRIFNHGTLQRQWNAELQMDLFDENVQIHQVVSINSLHLVKYQQKQRAGYTTK